VTEKGKKGVEQGKEELNMNARNLKTKQVNRPNTALVPWNT
jgi:hypothetical protein